MDRRKRVETTLQHREPDRIPWYCSLNYKAYKNIKDFIEINTERETVFNHKMVAKMELEVADALGIDLYYLSLISWIYKYYR